MQKISRLLITTEPACTRELMRQPKNPFHPGEILLEEFLQPAGITQMAFAKKLNWTRARLNELIKGKRGITAEAALDLAKALAQEAGFEFVAASDVNANPRDTRDHPFGVWTLPPTYQSAPLGQPEDPGFDTSPYEAIGESDRMTLRFVKP